jgi:hypothetical protein
MKQTDPVLRRTYAGRGAISSRWAKMDDAAGRFDAARRAARAYICMAGAVRPLARCETGSPRQGFDQCGAVKFDSSEGGAYCAVFGTFTLPFCDRLYY